jgi:hypothetical protein
MSRIGQWIQERQERTDALDPYLPECGCNDCAPSDAPPSQPGLICPDWLQAKEPITEEETL